LQNFAPHFAIMLLGYLRLKNLHELMDNLHSAQSVQNKNKIKKC